jgi:hypothetical protein
MNPERTIQLTHKTEDGKMEQIEVRMLYCAASETGFQALSGETIDVFTPVLDKDDNGKISLAAGARKVVQACRRTTATCTKECHAQGARISRDQRHHQGLQGLQEL